MKKLYFVFITIFTCLGVEAQTTDSVTNKFNKIPFTPFDVFAKFSGGNFEAYIEKNIKYPAVPISNVNSEIVIAFSVDTGGNVINIQLLKNILPAIDNEVINAFKTSPKWTPAKLKGSNVKVNIGMRLQIVADSATKTLRATKYSFPGQNITSDSNTVFAAVEVPPSYINGPAEFAKYLDKNVNYPDSALRNKVEGRVILSFVVEKDGSLSGIKPLRSPSPDLSNECIRVMQVYKFVPGSQNGKPVRVQYVTAIYFNLNKPQIHSKQLN